MIRVDTDEALPFRFPKMAPEDVEGLDRSLRFVLALGPAWLRPKPTRRRRRSRSR